MIGLRRNITCATVTVLTGLFGTAVLAAEPKVNSVGIGTAWQGQITTGVHGRTFTEQQVTLLGEINAYFNAITHLQGRFKQTDAQKQTLRGRFYVQRPGRFRFDYGRPSRLVIVSDGRRLTLEDVELNTTETYALNSTPFGIVLKKDVDILRDADVLSLAEDGDLISIAMKDKKEDSGAITLRFQRQAEPAPGDTPIELVEWVVTDAQGLETLVAVNNLVRGKKVKPALFRRSVTGLPDSHSSRN